MSWLAPSTTDQRLVDEIAARQPTLHALALVLAPALRIEPLLLRNARLRFRPQSEAGLESQLWFSPLVGARSARSVILRPGVARLLNDTLEDGAAAPSFDEVWRFIQAHIGHWSLEDRLEQELRQAARRGHTQVLRSGLRLALARVAAVPPARRRDLARWLKAALPALDGDEQVRNEIGLAAGFAAASLGDPGGTLAGHLADGAALPDWLRAMVPPMKAHEIGLRLWPGVLEITAVEEAPHRLDLGAPAPAPLHIACAGEQGGRWETCWPGRRIALPSGCTALTLMSLGGNRHQLAAKVAGQQARAKHDARDLTGSIYISNAGDDPGEVESITAWLRSRFPSADVWFDLVAPDLDAHSMNDINIEMLGPESHVEEADVFLVVIGPSAPYQDMPYQVQSERDLIAYRAQSAGTPVIPVLGDSASPELLNQLPPAMTAQQAIPVTQTNFDSDMEEVAKRIRDHLETRQQRAPADASVDHIQRYRRDRLLKGLRHLLRQTTPDMQAGLVHALGLSVPPGLIEGEDRVSQLLADELLAKAGHAPGLFERFRDIIKIISHGPIKQALKELWLATRALWVDAQQVARLEAASESHRPVLMSGSLITHSDARLAVKAYTVERYLESMPAGAQALVAMAKLSGYLDPVLDGIKHEIRQLVASSLRLDEMPDEQLDRLVNRDKRLKVLVVDDSEDVFPRSDVAAQLSTLNAIYKHLLIIFASSDQALRSELPDDFESIAVDPDEEIPAYKEEMAIVDLLERLQAPHP